MTERTRSKLAGLAPAGAALVALSALFWASGSLFPESIPASATSECEVTGMALMLLLVPAYLLAALAIAQQRSLDLIEQLRPLLRGPKEAERAATSVREALGRSWKLGSVIGIAFGLLNTEPIAAIPDSGAPFVAGSLAVGQLILWSTVGIVGLTRIGSAQAFRRLGGSISFDLFRLGELRPFARAGMVDVVLIAGALLFTPLQSLDAEFRWYNYQFALAVALPAAAFFLLWPVVDLRRRLLRVRHARLEVVEAQLGHLSFGDDSEQLVRSEILLAHRDRLRAAPTTPLSSRLLSRVLFFLVLPPLAWAGAAFVERLLMQALDG